MLTPYVFATERPRRITAGGARWRSSGFLRGARGPPVRTRPARRRAERRRRSYPVHVRFSDVDVYGHVNNVKYFEYFQEARISLFADLGREHVRGRGGAQVGGRPDRRRLPAPDPLPAEPYDCWSWVTAVGTTSMTLDSEIRDGDEVLSRARVVAVCFDAETQRPAPLPDALRAALAALP